VPPSQTVASLAGQKRPQARIADNRTGKAGIISAPAPVAGGHAAVIRRRCPCLDCGQVLIEKEYV
jgi:hypothetical protein